MASKRRFEGVLLVTAMLLAGLLGCGKAPSRPSSPQQPRAVMFSGVITDEATTPGADPTTPEPVVGATVVVTPLAHIHDDDDGKAYERQGVTNERGEFQVEVPPDQYQVLVYYIETVVRRVIDVRKPTVMRQAIDSNFNFSGMILDCSSEAAESCGTPEQLDAMDERRLADEERRRQEAEDELQREDEARRATEAAAEAERQRVAEQEKADNVRRASNRTKQGLAFLAEAVFDAALEEFLAAYELAPVPQGLYHLGLAYEGLKDRRSALDAYQRYVDAEPDGADADEARKRIAKLTKQLKKK